MKARTVWPIAVMVHATACAADAGDPLKVPVPVVGAMPDSAVPASGVDASYGAVPDASLDTTGTTSEVPDASTLPPTDSSTNLDSNSLMEDASVGAGCTAGATVITLMPGPGQFTANSGNFNTLAPVCVQLLGSVHQGWGISNGQGRMIVLTSSTGMSAPIDAAGSTGSLPAAPQAGSDGYVYWNFTADTAMVNYTSVYIF